MKQTNNNAITEMVFILDKSGSMAGLESDTIGGFNSLIEKQQKEEGTCFVTTVLFESQSQTLHDRIPLEEIKPLNEEDYLPGGCTALYDSIGNTIHHIENIHRYVRKEDVPQKTVFVIITDGYENASREFSHAAIKKLISKKEEKDGWEFLFIGANIDAAATVESLGIERENAANYKADSQGTSVVFEALAAPMMAIRRNKKIATGWAKEIEEDCEKRK